PLGGADCADHDPVFHQIDTAVESNDSFEGLQHNYRLWQPYLRKDPMKVFVEVTDDESDMPAKTFDGWLLSLDGMFGTANSRRYIFDSIVGWVSGTPLPLRNLCATDAGV